MAKVTSGTTVLEVDHTELRLLIRGLEALRRYEPVSDEGSVVLDLIADLSEGGEARG